MIRMTGNARQTATAAIPSAPFEMAALRVDCPAR